MGFQMSDIVNEFVTALQPLAEGQIKGSAKIVLPGEGAILLTETGAVASDADADVTLTAAPDVFRNIMSGDQNPMMAFMSGKLKVDGSNTRALKVSAILTGA